MMHKSFDFTLKSKQSKTQKKIKQTNKQTKHQQTNKTKQTLNMILLYSEEEE